MLNRYRQSEPAFDRRVQAHNDARRARICTFLLLCVLAAGIWLLLRTVREAGGWLAIF